MHRDNDLLLLVYVQDDIPIEPYPSKSPVCLLNYINRPLSNYTSVPANNNRKSRLRAKFSYICCIFLHEALTSGYCSWELKRNSKVVFSLKLILRADTYGKKRTRRHEICSGPGVQGLKLKTGEVKISASQS